MNDVTRITVDSTRMRAGAPNAIRVERDARLQYAEAVKVGAGMFVTSPVARPYGATIWFETTEPVILCSRGEDAVEEHMEVAA